MTMPAQKEFIGQKATLAEMARSHGVNLSTFYSRLSSGWTIQQALTGKRNLSLDEMGEVMQRIKDGESLITIAGAYGIPKSTLLNRLRRGWDKLKACTFPPKQENHTAARRGLSSADELFNAPDIVPPTAGNVINTYILPQKTVEELEKKGKTISQLAEECDMLPHTLYSRLRLGWDLERALTTPINGMFPLARKKISVGDVFEAVDICNGTRSRVNFRITQIVKCAAGKLAICHSTTGTRRESFTRAQLMACGYDFRENSQE
jgi:lambda repressor-like predicted transcriptional regulator